ncbi:MAG TPA: twin-arginine translocase subunit TatB, partial [Hyphomonas atlantica]|nr:twin-arginine translocase subunit TatB [Hyphomonas atlantica]
MLPGIGFSELLLLGLAALIIVGPKDLPMMMRRIGQFVGKGR